jgi:methylenetetrahydrofolate dehydrogenase (NADP+)/methenyltetrahydrofolate cyclohydrolase
MLLLAHDATVTYCHSHIEKQPSIVRDADIAVAAVGRRRFMRATG